MSSCYEPKWLLLVVYSGFLCLLATIQVRFAAQFVVPLSVLGGVGFVYFLSYVDLARRPTLFGESVSSRSPVATDGGQDGPSLSVPGGAKALYMLLIAVIVCGFGLIYVPSLSSQITYSDAEYEATQAIQEFEEDVDREYPENFVLSEWPRNRMHNYHVNGKSSSYGYADRHYTDFLSLSPDQSYGEHGDRVGYVVVTDQSASAGSTQAALFDERGDGTAHYRAIYFGESTAAFAVVPEATIEHSVGANTTVTAATEVQVSGETIAYEREAVSDEDGVVTVTVPYPGEYTIGEETVTVTESDVMRGATVSRND